MEFGGVCYCICTGILAIPGCDTISAFLISNFPLVLLETVYRIITQNASLLLCETGCRGTMRLSAFSAYYFRCMLSHGQAGR